MAKKAKALKCKFGWFLELFFALEKNLGKFCKKTGEISSRPSGNSGLEQRTSCFARPQLHNL
jgi:hypothetical protein